MSLIRFALALRVALAQGEASGFESMDFDEINRLLDTEPTA